VSRLTDLHGDAALGLTVRLRLINAANYSGNHELVLVAFTWCLAQMDRDEELRKLSERKLLWYHRQNLRQTLSSRDFLGTIGPHIVYLSLTGRNAAALKLFETGVAWLAVTRRTWERMLFAEHAAVLFERMASEANEPIQIRIPEAIPIYRSDDTYRPAAVAAAMNDMRMELAAEFDRRNQNQSMEHRHQRFRQLLESL
jgi:hypothetical protein